MDSSEPHYYLPSALQERGPAVFAQGLVVEAEARLDDALELVEVGMALVVPLREEALHEAHIKLSLLKEFAGRVGRQAECHQNLNGRAQPCVPASRELKA